MHPCAICIPGIRHHQARWESPFGGVEGEAMWPFAEQPVDGVMPLFLHVELCNEDRDDLRVAPPLEQIANGGTPL